MDKKLYCSPEADTSLWIAQAMICDSLTGGIDDYEMVDDYQWTE